jgi:hypothetical protein
LEMMLPVMLKAPATAARTRPAASSHAYAAVLPVIGAHTKVPRSQRILKLQRRQQRTTAVAGQGDTVLSDGTFTTTTNSSARTSGSGTMTAPPSVKQKQQPSSQDTFSQSPAKPAAAAEADAETAKDAHHFDWNKQW